VARLGRWLVADEPGELARIAEQDEQVWRADDEVWRAEEFACDDFDEPASEPVAAETPLRFVPEADLRTAALLADPEMEAAYEMACEDAAINDELGREDAEELEAELAETAYLAEKGYDADWFRQQERRTAARWKPRGRSLVLALRPQRQLARARRRRERTERRAERARSPGRPGRPGADDPPEPDRLGRLRGRRGVVPRKARR
jgi:hypothetical protein